MSLKILLIDNSPTIKKVFTLALHGYDYNLKTTTLNVFKSTATLELIKSFQPQLIFIDSLIQEVEISEFIQKCRVSTTESIVLLKNSLLKSTDSIDRLIQSKVINNVLEKPFNKQALRDIIHPYVYNEDSTDLDAPVTLDPIIKWENNLEVEKTEVLYNTPNKVTTKAEKINKQAEDFPIPIEPLRKIILEQLNSFFQGQSKKIIIELATPIVQAYVQDQVKILAKNIIELEIQKMLNQADTPSKISQL